MIKRLYRINARLENLPLLLAIRKGFTLTIPLFIVGAIPLILQYMPIPVVEKFIAETLDGQLYRLLETIHQATYGIASLVLLVTVSFKYARMITKKHHSINIINTMVAVCSYFALLGVTELVQGDGESLQVTLAQALNVQSVFLALVVSIVSTRLFLAQINFVSYLGGKLKKHPVHKERDFEYAIRAIFPMLINVFFFSAISLGVLKLTGERSINGAFIKALSSPFVQAGRNFPSGVLIIFLESLLWMFGIHGSNVFESINLTVFFDIESEIITKTFFDTFVLMGGSGVAVCLLIAILIFSKQKSSKALARRAAIPMLFNINELLLFGLPTVLNPIFAIPFVITPLVCMTTSYLAFSMGWVPLIANSVEWTTPILISGYLATGSFAGMILQLVNIILGILIYTPFVLLNSKFYKTQTQEDIAKMTSLVKTAEALDQEISLMGKNDHIGANAENIALAIREGIEKKTIAMFYQPQVNKMGTVIGLEALLRFSYEKEYLYPPLVISIAKEDNSYELLTDYIIDKTLEDTREINKLFGRQVKVSVNIQSQQFSDMKFILKLVKKVRLARLLPQTFCVEITEEARLFDNTETKKNFALLKENNILIAIDDFSMGHTSLNYLTSNRFNFVKLDGNLVKEMLTNNRAYKIIDSICKLGQDLGFTVIAEYVETEGQRNALMAMGCYIYQGWLYSPALSLEKVKSYISERKQRAFE